MYTLNLFINKFYKIEIYIWKIRILFTPFYCKKCRTFYDEQFVINKFTFKFSILIKITVINHFVLLGKNKFSLTLWYFLLWVFLKHNALIQNVFCLVLFFIRKKLENILSSPNVKLRSYYSIHKSRFSWSCINSRRTFSLCIVYVSGDIIHLLKHILRSNNFIISCKQSWMNRGYRFTFN